MLKKTFWNAVLRKCCTFVKFNKYICGLILFNVIIMTLEILSNDDQVTGKLSGRLDTAASHQFATDIEPLKAQANKKIVLDFTNLEFISSSGLRLLLSLRKETVVKGGSITITGVNPDIEQVFAITGFKTLFIFE